MGHYDQLGGTRVSRLFMQDEWVPNLHYHLIGKAVPGELLFHDAEEYRRFLRKSLREGLRHVFEFHAYCLLPNHWHGGIRTRCREEIIARLRLRKRLRAGDRAFLDGEKPYAEYISYCFRAAIMRYAKWFNSRHGREGQLFIKPTLHGLTDKGAPGVEFSRTMIAYIGLNYAKHHLAAPTEFYHWSSLRCNIYQIIELDIERYYETEAAYKAFHVTYMAKYGKRFYAFDEEDFFKALQPRTYIPDINEWRLGEWRKPQDRG